MDLYFWNAYKRLEKEVLELSEYIHISDDQLDVYSLQIGDLLVRTAIEAETLVKLLRPVRLKAPIKLPSDSLFSAQSSILPFLR